MTTSSVPTTWSWPLAVDQYDRSPALTVSEGQALACLGTAHGFGGRTLQMVLASCAPAARLITPLQDAMDVMDGNAYWKERALVALLRGCWWEQRAFWGWDLPTWVRLLAPATTRKLTANRPTTVGATRHYMIAAAYLLGCLPDLGQIPQVEWRGIASKALGSAATTSIERIDAVLARWGYSVATRRTSRSVTARALLQCRSPLLEQITSTVLEELHALPEFSKQRRGVLAPLARALVELGVLPRSLVSTAAVRDVEAQWTEGLAPAWGAAVRRWEATSTLTPKTRGTVRTWLLKVGRWAHEHHPAADAPAHWDRELAADAVAAIGQLRVGEYCFLPPSRTRDVGKPLAPRSRAAALAALRMFFRDLQEWEWIARRFDPQRAFGAPRSLRALIGPAPRPIADDSWAKLIWAGLDLSRDDFQALQRRTSYPIAMIRALAITWLFAGLRSDELLRLEVGCIRQPGGEQTVATAGDAPRSEVCLLQVPVHKTGAAFTKPVDQVVGEAIAAWEAVRPSQPTRLDRKTGQPTTPLFLYRARPVSPKFLTHSLIRVLCDKAGVPLVDATGAITSHRARATIASQLYNAKEPLTLFELQAWLGHRSPESTQHYARITPHTLTKAFTDAGYFARNVRAIEVLVDREAVESGATATGTPWQYFDLGHGYCTYSFFEQCPHRMACARCDFYVPKASTRAQLLEAKNHLQRMVATIPLTDDEQTAVEEGAAAVDRLLERLVDLPTPAGPTPRQLGVILLPVISIEKGLTFDST
jgi:integrase